LLKNGGFYIGACSITLVLRGNSSLKGKRSVLNRIKDRVKNRFNIAISEVGELDVHQVAHIAAATVGNDRTYIEGQLTHLIEYISGLTEAEVSHAEISIDIKGKGENVLF